MLKLIKIKLVYTKLEYKLLVNFGFISRFLFIFVDYQDLCNFLKVRNLKSYLSFSNFQIKMYFL